MEIPLTHGKSQDPADRPITMAARTARPRFEEGSFTNPVLAGDFPDPSVIRDGELFYLVASSFVYYPGLMVWSSSDLVDWSPVGAAVEEPVGSIYAPELTKHDGRFFIYFAVREVPEMEDPARETRRAGLTNYVVYADSIEGPWSSPIDLGIPGFIDPGHAVGEDGRRYLYVSEGVLVPLTDDGLGRAGSEERLYDGWAYPDDWEVESFSLEGPKIVRRDEWFYMFSSQGGTAGPPTSHMVVVARSRSIRGPWENAPTNPLIRTRSASEVWWSRGHGTPIEDAAGQWWLVQHAYENGRRTLGRQTIIEPIDWPEGGWPSCRAIDLSAEIARPWCESGQERTASRHSSLPSVAPLGARVAVFKPRPGYLDRVRTEADAVVIQAYGETVAETSPVVFNAADRDYEFTVELTADPVACAGLLLFYNEAFHCGIGYSDGRVRGFSRGAGDLDVHSGGVQQPPKFIRVRNRGQVASFFSSSDGQDWVLHASFEVSGYNHNVAGKFLSLRPAVFALGRGSATLHSLDYHGL